MHVSRLPSYCNTMVPFSPHQNRTNASLPPHFVHSVLNGQWIPCSCVHIISEKQISHWKHEKFEWRCSKIQNQASTKPKEKRERERERERKKEKNLAHLTADVMVKRMWRTCLAWNSRTDCRNRSLMNTVRSTTGRRRHRTTKHAWLKLDMKRF